MDLILGSSSAYEPIIGESMIIFWFFFVFVSPESLRPQLPSQLFGLPIRSTWILEPAGLKCEGACISRKDCEAAGGRSSGTCVNERFCCRFERTCSGVGKEKISFFVSPGYPSQVKGPIHCSMKMEGNFAALKLDFLDLPFADGIKVGSSGHICLHDNFIILGGLSGPGEGMCTMDGISGIVFSKPKQPITFLVVSQSNVTRWKVKVSQVSEEEIQMMTNAFKSHEGCGRQLIFEPPIVNTFQLKKVNERPTKIIPLIIGGINAEGNEFPWQASIQILTVTKKWHHICGGSVISNKTIITAAHCLVGKKNQFNKTRIVLGLDDIGSEKEIYHIESIISHLEYTPSLAFLNDIAVIRVVENIKFSRNLLPICLFSKDVIEYGEATVSGWGRLNATQGNPQNLPLQKTTVNIVETKNCKLYEISGKVINYNVPSSQLCTVSANSTSICFGDSGGPLVKRSRNGLMELIGIVSYGFSSCSTNLPSVFTRVSSFERFISLAVLK